MTDTPFIRPDVAPTESFQGIVRARKANGTLESLAQATRRAAANGLYMGPIKADGTPAPALVKK